MTASTEDVISNLRAIIISSKGGLDLSEIGADYKETFGVDIPLKPLGCKSLQEFFINNPQNFIISGTRVQAVVKASSLHISALVSRQKTTSKPRGRSKLSSKKISNIRKPTVKQSDSLCNVKDSSRKDIQSLSPAVQQSSNKVTTIAKQQKKNPHYSKSIQEKTSNTNLTKSLMDIKRTIKNNTDMSIKKTDSSENVSAPFKEVPEIQSSPITQLYMSKLRKSFRNVNFNNNTVEVLDEKLDVSISPLGSPFRRSLANSTAQQIHLAETSAKLNLCEKKYEENDAVQETKMNQIETFSLSDGNKYENLLKQFCRENSLIMPTYSIIIRETNGQSKCYGCKLNIGDHFTMSTYPVETDSEVSARELASKKAFTHLKSNGFLPQMQDTEYVIKLRNLCNQKYLPDPVFKSMECHPKNQRSFFICKVRIGDEILLSSYPVEAVNEFTARDLAAMKAFDHLNQGSKSNMGKSYDNNVILSRIFDIIKEREYGVWHNKLPNIYMEKYNEELQSNWFDLIKKSSKFEISTIERVGYIIRSNNSTEIVENSLEPQLLSLLKLPESNQWEVYITNVVTSAEIWCRLIGKDYSEVYDSMMTKIELHPPTVKVQMPLVGEVYLVNIEESWNRVKVLEVSPEKETASVFLIDIGVDEVVKLSQLFYLDKSLFSVPPQAIMLSLNELDYLAEYEQLQGALFHSLLGSTFIAEIVAILDEGGNVCSVNLWDTSTEEDVNVNMKLLDDVIKTIQSPTLPTSGIVKEMFVSHVEENGDVYLQSSKQGHSIIEWIISTKMKNSRSLVSVADQNIDMKKLYITRSAKTGLFYRSKALKLVNPSVVLLKFIDYGYEQEAPLDDLLDLEQTSLDLATIPSQVVHARLSSKGSLNNKIMAKIRDQILEQSVLVKVTQILPGSPPRVELLKRSQADGTLSLINNKFDADDGIPMTESLPSRKRSYVVGLETTLSQHLPMPNIPPVGSFFNVFVTLAAHPGLFNVQPLTTQSELMQLMFRLQLKCESTFTKPLSPEDFKIGELYAVRHTDNFWYRAYAQALTGSSSFMVCLCDFGDFVEASPENLMPLSGEFKTFPYQAIRAYLAGIKPVEKDWSAIDCVYFRELVVEKQFVSQIIEINRDVKNPNYISLGLALVDTTKEVDVYVHKLLIEKNMAVLKK
ncbi:hypothetical protein RUM43_013985 [Polyplax serrata]|uniref:Tudor domain-containing protein 7 n=1 Tax=Polyplax serrata TaxID=468196 RepID=A0AAN8PSX8_POLSC